MNFNRAVAVKSGVKFSEGVQVELLLPLEISLDCFICQRKWRTIIVNEAPRCTPTQHSFPCRLLRAEVVNNPTPELAFEIEYEFRPFTDIKYPQRWDASYRPSWARISFRARCPQCGKSATYSTQSNLVRPWAKRCDCGEVLYEDNEPPRFENFQVLDENGP